MPRASDPWAPRERRAALAVLVLALAIVLTGCGSAPGAPTVPTASTQTSTEAAALPGTGRPQVTIGDKNFTEQFVLGELYALALQAQGFSVSVNRNIGPTEVTVGALQSGRLDMYPEYLDVFNMALAGDSRTFASVAAAYAAGRRWANHHGMELLRPTPFSNTEAIAVTAAFAAAHHLRTLSDLRRVAIAMTLGAPAELAQGPSGLPAIEQAYGFTPASVKTLDIGEQYAALDQGTVQAAYVNTTDGQLSSGAYRLLADPDHIFGQGNVVPVVTTQTLSAEGPAFASTIDTVSRLLTTPVMRQLGAAVDVYHQDPAAVAKQFLVEHGIVAATS
ncbi:MAG: ABC transporter substrate-binding protein [Solirubrobacteraceae bacterium]